MVKKDEILWALLDAMSSRGGQAANPAMHAKAAPVFDWRAEEKDRHGLAKYSTVGKGYYAAPPEQTRKWVDDYPEKNEWYHEGKDYPYEKKKCFCEPWPWEEEKWICTKESRICCEKIPCEKKKEPRCGSAPGYWSNGLR
jgi:hypothetical protein